MLQADCCICCRAPDTGAAASEHQGKQITLAAHGEGKAVAGCLLSRGNPNEMDMYLKTERCPPGCKVTGMPLVQGAPRLKLLLLSTKANNLWEDGTWTAAIVDRLRSQGVQVIQNAGYKTSLPAIEQCLHEELEKNPKLLKYAKLIL